MYLFVWSMYQTIPSAPTAGSWGKALGRGRGYSTTTGSGERGAGSRQTTTAKAARRMGERVIGRSWRAAGEVASRLVSRARPVQRGSMMSEFPAQRPPTPQSVLLRRAIRELAPPDGDTRLIFSAQRTLASV